MTLGEGGGGGGRRTRTVQWVVERDGSGTYRDHTPSIRIKLNGGMFRTLPMKNITHAAGDYFLTLLIMVDGWMDGWEFNDLTGSWLMD